MYQLMVQEGWLYNQENGESWNLEKHEHWVNPDVFFPEQKPFPLYWLIDNSAYQRANPMVCNGSCRKTEPRVSSPFDGQYARPNNRPIQPLNGREIYYFEEFEQ